jgi:hypothetical protein
LLPDEYYRTSKQESSQLTVEERRKALVSSRLQQTVVNAMARSIAKQRMKKLCTCQKKKRERERERICHYVLPRLDKAKVLLLTLRES